MTQTGSSLHFPCSFTQARYPATAPCRRPCMDRLSSPRASAATVLRKPCNTIRPARTSILRAILSPLLHPRSPPPTWLRPSHLLTPSHSPLRVPESVTSLCPSTGFPASATPSTLKRWELDRKAILRAAHFPTPIIAASCK